jgi:hypothetical protein
LGYKETSAIFFGMAYRIKMKLPGCYEGDFQLTKRQHVHATTFIIIAATACPTTTTTTVMLILLRLSA